MTGNRAAEVEAFVEALDHPLQAEIAALRALILGADAAISERIKWNAPSFCYGGDDRVTMKLHPPRSVQLIFHRGAKAQNSSDFVFEDTSGLVKRAAPDRGVVTLRDMGDVEEHRDALVDLVKRWIVATS